MSYLTKRSEMQPPFLGTHMVKPRGMPVMLFIHKKNCIIGEKQSSAFIVDPQWH
jgi:hypothetical protein